MRKVPVLKIKNMYSCEGTNREVPNQFSVSFPNGKEYFQSYEKVIVYRPSFKGQIYLDRKYWDYSVTTGMYRNQYLGEGIAETRKKIKGGTYRLANLNQGAFSPRRA